MPHAFPLVVLWAGNRDHAPKTDSSNASLHAQGPLLQAAVFLRHSKSVRRGCAPRLFRPMYAGANMGHPSREQGSFFARTTAPPMNSNTVATIHWSSSQYRSRERLTVSARTQVFLLAELLAGGLFAPGVITGDLMGLYQEDPRSQKRDLGHPSWFSYWALAKTATSASRSAGFTSLTATIWRSRVVADWIVNPERTPGRAMRFGPADRWVTKTET
jgi:hypothetical protein